MKLIDLIFPKRCVNCKKVGDYICDSCFSYLSFDLKNRCLICYKSSYSGLTHISCRSEYSIDGIFSAISYNKIAKKLIHDFKEKPYLSDLGGFLSELFTESIIQNEEFNKLIGAGKWILVPIPLSPSDMRKRGYNQSEILAEGISKKINIKSLNTLSKKKDSELVLNTQKKIIEKLNILLVADFVEKGRALKEAARLLKKSGAKQVLGVTLAQA